MKFDHLPRITPEEVSAALDTAVEQVRRNLPDFTDRCQNHSSVNNVYPPCPNDQWTCGFWPGEVWLAYERAGGSAFEYTGRVLVKSFLDRIERKVEVDHHDMGFLYTPACVAAWKLTGDERAKKAAVLAADQLLTRFQPQGNFLQAWGAMGAPENYRYIIDCLLNLPLLYWASDVTGDGKYRDIALKHTATCLKYSVRPDGSTYHTYFLNSVTGEGDHGATCQGYRDDSSWARGQAWAVYGMALSYRYTKDPQCIDTFRRTRDYFMDRLPTDMVPYWDLVFTDGSGEPRDSSSASIVACGLLEMAPFLPKEEGDACRADAERMLKSLADHYAVKPGEGPNGLVLHGTYSKKSPYNTCTPEGVDECVSWGDYFYMEGLTRLSKTWDPYW